MPTIVCECGKKILVIPDIEEMASCIGLHAKLHGQKVTDPENAKLECNRIDEQLTQKVLIEIAKMKNTDGYQ